MSWIDKLLGRDKADAPEAPAATQPPAEPYEPEAPGADERAAEARDESLGSEGRIPPGTG